MNISGWKRQHTIIGHLKAYSWDEQEHLDRTVLRLHMERLLSNIDLYPPGLSSGALLIVRRITSLSPEGLSVSTQVAGASLQEFLGGQVATLYATAARPALEAVPLNASSVLFADVGEMLTCLTRDLLNRQVGERWYWQQVLRDMPRTPDIALPMLWCEQANYVPTVLALLHPTEVLSAITQFTPIAVKQVIGALHERFELPPEMFIALTHRKPGALSNTRVAQDLHRGVVGPVVSAQMVRGVAPWQQWLFSTQMPELAPEAHYLLGLGLALYHAPSFARSTGFATQAVQWLQAVSESQTPDRSLHSSKKADVEMAPLKQDAVDVQSVPSENVREQRHIQIEDSAAYDTLHRQTALLREEERSPAAFAGDNDDMPPTIERKPFPSSTRLDGDSERGPVRSQGTVPAPEQELIQQGRRGPETEVSTELPKSDPVVPPSYPLETVLPVASAAPGETKTRTFLFGESKTFAGDGVTTHLGGVLYLINLLTWLKLPHSWDNDGTFARQMSGWAVVEVLAHGLLGRLHEQYRQDPIWQVLALLDGRKSDHPIMARNMVLAEARAFRLPASWLKPLGEVVLWSAFQKNERLLLFDDVAGFLVADVPLHGHTFFAVAQAEVGAYRDAGLDVSWHIGNLTHAPVMLSERAVLTTFPEEWEKYWLSAYMGEEVWWWLVRMLGFVHHMLAQMLDEPIGDGTQLAELLLCQPGQLVVSRTHVDVYMSIEEIRIAIRRAGLDRNPGWVPDLARIVYLHFE